MVEAYCKCELYHDDHNRPIPSCYLRKDSYEESIKWSAIKQDLPDRDPFLICGLW